MRVRLAPALALALTLAFGALAHAALEETPTTLTGGKIVSSAEAKAFLGKAHFFDMRKAVNFGKGHIPGAAALPYEQKSEKSPDFDASLDSFDTSKLPPDKAAPIVFYSDGPTGWKSYKAAVLAIRSGYTKVMWFRGGMAEWTEQGFEVNR